MDRPRFTLTTTGAPRPTRRRCPPPTLTVERGPRNAGASGVTLEPEGPRADELSVWGRTKLPEGQATYFVAFREHAPNTPCMVEVRMTGPGLLMKDAAIVFLLDACERLMDAGCTP